MNYNDLKQALGPIKSAHIVKDLPDHEYHKQADFASSSVVKEYLQDPILAGARRILKTAPPKVFGEQVKKSLRIGRAVHAWVFEGQEVMKARFPVFSGGRRAGKAWDEFKEQNPEACKNDDILSMDEYMTVESTSKASLPIWKEYLANMEKSGTNILALVPECSFYVTYENGLAVKVRTDMILICQSQQNPSQYWFVIQDGKTSSRSISDHVGLSFAIGDFGYDLSAAMYLNTVQDCLQHTNLWPELIPGFDVSGWPPIVPLWGQFNIFWMSTMTHQCGFQQMTNVTDAEPGTWTESGVTAYYLGLLKMENELKRLTGRLSEMAQTGSKELGEGLEIAAPPVKKHHWVLKDRQEEMRHFAVPTSYTNAQSLRQVRDDLITPPEAPALVEKTVRDVNNSLALNISIPQATPTEEAEDTTLEVNRPSPTPEQVAEIAAKLGWNVPQKRSNITQWKAPIVDKWLFELGVEPKGILRERQNIIKDILFPKGGN